VEERVITKARAMTLCRFKYLKRASLKPKAIACFWRSSASAL
jgi:hypothetical protein